MMSNEKNYLVVSRTTIIRDKWFEFQRLYESNEVEEMFVTGRREERERVCVCVRERESKRVRECGWVGDRE